MFLEQAVRDFRVGRPRRAPAPSRVRPERSWIQTTAASSIFEPIQDSRVAGLASSKRLFRRRDKSGTDEAPRAEVSIPAYSEQVLDQLNGAKLAADSCDQDPPSFAVLVCLRFF
jgi:hypothetical protein